MMCNHELTVAAYPGTRFPSMQAILEDDRPRSSLQSRHAKKPFAYFMLLMFYALVVALYLCSTASARPTQSDVFKSIQDNVSESSDVSGKVLLLIGGGAALLVLLAVFSKRQDRGQSPKPVRNQSRLLKEVRKAVPLKKAEIRQVRLVAEQTTRGDGEPISSPLVLLLCPSVLAKAAQDRNTKADRKVLAQVIRKVAKSRG